MGSAEARDSPDPVVVPFPAPFPLLAALPSAPFPVPPPKVGSRSRSRFRSSLRNVSPASLRLPIDCCRRRCKERLFRSIPKIDLFFRSCRSHQLIDRGRNGWIVSALNSAAAFTKIHPGGDLRPTTMRPMTNGFSECCGRTRR